MISAFGVDHGSEISKGARLRLVRVPKGAVFPGGKRPTAAQIATMSSGRKQKTMTAKTGNKVKAATERALSIKGIGEATGAGAHRAGRTMEKYPRTAGTAIVGGAGGAGYLGYRKKTKKSGS